jgi:hypothetical protein
MSECGESGMYRVLTCNKGGIRGWSRWGTQEEIDTYHASGDLPAHETTATMQVSSCPEHAVACGLAEVVVPNPNGSDDPAYVGTELATVTHDSTCLAPATEGGSCSVCDAYLAHHGETG